MEIRYQSVGNLEMMVTYQGIAVEMLRSGEIIFYFSGITIKVY